MEPTELEGKVNDLKTTWDDVLAKSAKRQAELEAALEASHSFLGQIKELRGWLNEASEFLKSRRSIGGRPESATKQLNKHKDFMAVVESRQAIYDKIVETVEELVEHADPTTAANLQRQLDDLTESWNQVLTQATEEENKLKDALENAKDLDEKTNAIDLWLTRVEGTISLFEDPSTILETLQKQRVSYKVCCSACPC